MSIRQNTSSLFCHYELFRIEEELDAADLKNYVNEFISQLPEQRRRILIMSREGHLANKGIADRCASAKKQSNNKSSSL